jgi:hypothetical protein
MRGHEGVRAASWVGDTPGAQGLVRRHADARALLRSEDETELAATAELEQIAQAPEPWPILVDDLRKRPLRGFPYRVIYQVRGDHVLIVAVMHERRRPEYWRDRTYKRYLERDQADVVAVVFPVSERSESYFLFIRNAQRPRFEEHERDGLAYALRGIRWFHRHMLLFHGLLGTGAPLTVTERNALRCLLSGRRRQGHRRRAADRPTPHARARRGALPQVRRRQPDRADGAVARSRRLKTKHWKQSPPSSEVIETG